MPNIPGPGQDDEGHCSVSCRSRNSYPEELVARLVAEFRDVIPP